ncbi:MAG: hypothetical protein IKZ88_09890 [Neisseriaceae bacterium]|nr:hypothetical protein [Neisseriaceae bacterium]
MWSIEEAKRLKAQHEHGWTVGESAEILERSELDVRNKLLSMGLKPIEDGEKPAKARKKRQTVNAAIKAEIIRLRNRGYDYKYIGEHTNTSKATIARILRESGNTNAEHKKAVNNGLAEKYAELEKRIHEAETVINNQAEMISDKNEEIYKALKQVDELKEVIDETAKKPKETADNWSVRELKNVLELLEPLAIDNGADAIVIGEAIGRLKMMISIAYETERRHGF